MHTCKISEHFWRIKLRSLLSYVYFYIAAGKLGTSIVGLKMWQLVDTTSYIVVQHEEHTQYEEHALSRASGGMQA